jgi:arginyl-tRNA synthetase
MFKRENEQRRMLLVEIEEKMRRAEERKEQAVAEKIEAIAAQTKDKLQRAADVGKREEEQTKEMSTIVTTKVEMANQRRDKIIREQQEILKELAMKKERLFIERKMEEEKAIEVIGKVIRSKLHSATKRKEGIIASKVESIKIDNETKQARAKDVLLLSLNEATELKRMSDKRLKKATKKKNAVSLNCRANESKRQ